MQTTTDAQAPAGAPTRRDAARWFGVGAVLSGIVYVWGLTAGSFDLFARQRFGADFYDVQAHRLLGGHLSMPEDVLLIEAFANGSKSYMYFGPTPALLRLPVALVTDRLDGRLTQLSMLAAFALAMWFVGRLWLTARDAIRPDAPWSRAELVWTAAAAFVVGVGSTMLFLGGKPWVYHEASMWAIAFALGAFVAILDLTAEPSRGALLRAGGFAALSILSRLAIGLGPVLVLGLLALVAVALRVRPNRAESIARLSGVTQSLGKLAVGVVAAAVIPALCYVAVNQAKFDTPFSIPFDRQAQNAVDPHRQEVLAANGGSLLNVAALPTNLLAYSRPDNVRVTSTFPFLTFQEERAPVIGDVTFDLLDRQAGIPATMPAISALAIIGVVVAFRRRGPDDRAPTRWRLPLLGAAAALLPTLVIVYVAQRYLGDFMVLLLLGATLGIHWLARACTERGTTFARIATACLVLLGAWSCWVNLALAYEFRHTYAPFTVDDLRAARLGTQLDFADVLGKGAPTARAGRSLPPDANAGDYFVVGDCAGLYWYDGERWNGVERTNETGRFVLDVARRAGTESGAERVLVTTAPRGGATEGDRISIRIVDGDHARLVFRPEDGSPTAGRPFSFADGDVATLDVVMDRRNGDLVVTRDGGTVLGASVAVSESGAAGDAPRVVSGARDGITVRSKDVHADVCERLRDDQARASLTGSSS